MIHTPITLVGSLSSTVMHKDVAKQRHVARFSLRVGPKHYSCVAWGKVSQDTMELRRGDDVRIEGRLVHRQYEDKNFRRHHVTEVQIDRIENTRPTNGYTQ